MGWTREELSSMGVAEELQIASRRGDGSLRSDRTIWGVRDGDALYVRSVYGRSSAWFRGTRTRHEGHIRAGGVDRDVRFVERTEPALNDQLDAQYRHKYGRYAASILDAVTGPDARSATLEIVPD